MAGQTRRVLHEVAYDFCTARTLRVLHRWRGQEQNSRGSGPARFSRHTLGRPVTLLAFEESHDRHRMAVPEAEVRLEPGHHRTRLYTRLELTALHETLVGREPPEIRGALTGFRLDVVEVGLKRHGGILRLRRG